MSKILPATCVGGVVTHDGLAVPGAVILSKGIGESSGFLVIDEDKTWYIANASANLEATLEKVLDALGAVKSALQDIATGPVTPAGGSAGPTNPALATALGGYVTTIGAAETALNTLKGSLI